MRSQPSLLATSGGFIYIHGGAGKAGTLKHFHWLIRMGWRSSANEPQVVCQRHQQREA